MNYNEANYRPPVTYSEPNSRNCGTCCWRRIGARNSADCHKIVWLCDHNGSEKYMQDVSDPHGFCDRWERG